MVVWVNARSGDVVFRSQVCAHGACGGAKWLRWRPFGRPELLTADAARVSAISRRLCAGCITSRDVCVGVGLPAGRAWFSELESAVQAGSSDYFRNLRIVEGLA